MEKAKESDPQSLRTKLLIISEISVTHPKSRSDGRNLEFIELYNSQENIENLGGYTLSGEVDYTFPAGAFIQPGGYIVVAPSPSDIQVIYGLSRVYGGFANPISNNSGVIPLEQCSGRRCFWKRTTGPTVNGPRCRRMARVTLSILARPSYGEADPTCLGRQPIAGRIARSGGSGSGKHFCWPGYKRISGAHR